MFPFRRAAACFSRRLAVVLGMLPGLLAAMPAPADDDIGTLNFGIISTESSSGLKQSFGPFLDAMEAALGVQVAAFFATDYAGIVEAMRFAKVDVAWLDNKSAMEAVDRAGGEVFAQTVDLAGRSTDRAVLIVHRDSGLTFADVVRCDGRLAFGNGDPNSTAGYLAPAYHVFAMRRIDPGTCFKRMTLANHEANALSVASRRVDVATGSERILSGRLARAHPEAAARIKVIWTSPPIPSDPIVWRKDLPRVWKDRIFAFFLQYGRFGDLDKVRGEREVLAGTGAGWAPFRVSDDRQLILVRRLQMFRDRRRIDDNARLTLAEKIDRVGEIEARLEDLEIWSEIIGTRNPASEGPRREATGNRRRGPDHP